MEFDDNIQRRRSFLINVSYWAAIIAIVYFLLKYFINLVMPFFIASIFAAISRPLAKKLSSEARNVKLSTGEVVSVPRKLRLNKKFSGILSVILIFLIIAAFLVIIGSSIVDAVADMIKEIPDFYYENILPGLEDYVSRFETAASGIDNDVLESFQSALPEILTSIGAKITDFSARALVWISGIATRVPGFLLNALICLIATVFISIDFDGILTFFRRNLSEKTVGLISGVKNSFLDVIWQFIRSYFYIFLITAGEITLGLLIIGQQRPLLIAIIISVFDAFPIVGSGMILLPWAIITIVSGSVAKGVGLAVLYVTVVIVREIIEPKIVGKHVGLRPIVTLFCMYVGTKLFGGLGLLGLPVAAAIIADMNEDGILHFFTRSDS